MAGYVEGKDKNRILQDLVGTAQPGSPVHEQQRMGILVRCTEDIEAAIAGLSRSVDGLQSSMDRNAQSADSLARKVYWLNVVLVGATVVGTLVAAYGAFVSQP